MTDHTAHLASPHYVAVIEPRPTGFGPTVWVGELRTLSDALVPAWISAGQLMPTPIVGPTRCTPVSVGASEGQVLAALVRRAATIEALTERQPS